MTNITGLPSAKASELRKLLDEVTRTMPDQIEMMKILAKLDFEKFKALVGAGFTKEQALEIVKAEKIQANI